MPWSSDHVWVGGGGCLHCEGDWVETGLEKLFLFHCVKIQDQNTTEQF